MLKIFFLQAFLLGFLFLQVHDLNLFVSQFINKMFYVSTDFKVIKLGIARVTNFVQTIVILRQPSLALAALIAYDFPASITDSQLSLLRDLFEAQTALRRILNGGLSDKGGVKIEWQALDLIFTEKNLLC